MNRARKKADGRSTAGSSGIRRGRFKQGMDPLFAEFNASIAFDKRLYAEDIRGSVAHARMLARQKILSRKDAAAIEKGLKEVLKDIESGRFQFREELEDVHINVEEALRKKIGEVAGKLHTARSRNDQVALDLRMYLMGQTDLLRDDLVKLIACLADKAEEHIDTIMPGYTHLQRAQLVRLAHHLMAYTEMFRRDWERFEDCLKRLTVLPLGSAALAGTTFDIDRESVARELGFTGVSPNSMDAVSDRDFVADFIFNSAMVMMHLSRMSEELILWSSQEFNFCSLPDEFCSGSSIMPQKKNPDACELIRGKTGRVYGDLLAVLTTMKALPLTYNKDFQEDKEPVFDTIDTVRGSLGVMTALIPGIRFDRDRMMDAASDPSLVATDLADQLAREGLPFREAHARIGAMIRAKTDDKKRRGSRQLPSPGESVEARKHDGGKARHRVLEQIERARKFVKKASARPGQKPVR